MVQAPSLSCPTSGCARATRFSTTEGDGMTTMTDTGRVVTGGVDTHLDVHVAAVCDNLGAVLATASFDTTARGTGSCWSGCNATSTVSVSKAPGPTVPDSRVTWPAIV